MEEKQVSNTLGLQNNRPLSPHLSIYKLQLTSGLSILHRITGAYLYLGIIILSWALFSFIYFPDALENITYSIYSCALATLFFKLMLLCWIFALFYHLLNGIRHLFWDIGKGFTLGQTYKSGKLVLILSFALTLICWFMASSTPKETIIIEETVVIEGESNHEQ